MLIPIRQTVALSGGSVTLRAWGADTADAHLHDLLMITATLGQMREEWQAYRREDVTPDVWGAFWRLTHASVVGSLPKKLTWLDRLTILEALWHLNDIDEAETKMQALNSRAQRLLNKAREFSRNPTA